MNLLHEILAHISTGCDRRIAFSRLGANLVIETSEEVDGQLVKAPTAVDLKSLESMQFAEATIPYVLKRHRVKLSEATDGD